MAKYATKTCYECGIQNPANLMERVTESYNSGRSDRRPDGVNVAAFLLSDAATSRKMIKGAVTKNNRRSYTRNRTVWKCLDCSGHNASVQRATLHEQRAEQKRIHAAEKLQERKAEAVARMSVTSNGPQRSGVRPSILIVGAFIFGMVIMNAVVA